MGHEHDEKSDLAIEVMEKMRLSGDCRPWPVMMRTLEGKSMKDLRTMLDDLEDKEDICGLCGLPGADKIPHPIHWPGEIDPRPELVHALCEEAECRRAHANLTQDQRDRFLRSI